MKHLRKIYCFFSLVFTLVVVVLSANFQTEKCNLVQRNLTCRSDVHAYFDNVKESTTPSNILLNTSDFKELRLYSAVFVDKSEMINEYLERGGIVLTITRPTKWGKSVIIEMFKRFFEIEVDSSGAPVSVGSQTNRMLFTGGNIKTGQGTTKYLKPLQVSNYTSAMDHQGKNPVILLSLKDISGHTYDDFKKSMKDKMIKLYSEYPYLYEYVGNKTHPFTVEEGEKWEEIIFHRIKLKNSLHYLSKLLFKHFKSNVYIFIDDYDSVIKNAYLTFGAKSEDFRQILEMTYGIIGKALKENWFLERAILIGTFHFGWVNEILKLNDVRHSTIVDMTFSSFFGFTAVEVNNILRHLDVKVDPIQLKNWFNGYDFDRVLMYNPWSVLSCLSNRGKFDYYWGKIVHESFNLMDQVYLMDNPQEYLQNLLQDKQVIRKEINKPINFLTMEETFHRVFLFGGFFNSVPGFCESNCYIHPWNLSVPNLEIRGMLADGVSKWVSNKLNITTEEYEGLKNLFTEYKIERYSKTLQNYLMKTDIPKSLAEQQLFHHRLAGGLVCSLAKNYKIKSYRKAGQKSREYKLTSLPGMGSAMFVIEYEVVKGQKKMLQAVDIGIKKLTERIKTSEIKFTNYSKFAKIYMVFCKRKVLIKFDVSEIG